MKIDSNNTEAVIVSNPDSAIVHLFPSSQAAYAFIRKSLLSECDADELGEDNDPLDEFEAGYERWSADGFNTYEIAYNIVHHD